MTVGLCWVKMALISIDTDKQPPRKSCTNVRSHPYNDTSSHLRRSSSVPGTVLHTFTSIGSFILRTILQSCKAGAGIVSVIQEKRQLKHRVMELLRNSVLLSPLPMSMPFAESLYSPSTNGRVSFPAPLIWAQSCHFTCLGHLEECGWKWLCASYNINFQEATSVSTCPLGPLLLL